MDTITSITKYNISTGLPVFAPQNPGVLDFSVAKRYNGIFTQSGLDTLVTLSDQTPLYTSGMGLYVILFDNSWYLNDFVIEYNEANSFLILGSWSTISPLLDLSGKLKDSYDIYFPYVKVSAGADTSSYAWYVQTQKKKSPDYRLNYWD